MEAKLRPTILPPPDLQKHPEKAPELIKSLFRARDHSTRFWYSISVEHLVELARFLQKEMEGKFVTRIHEYYPDINYQQYRGLQKLLQYPELQVCHQVLLPDDEERRGPTFLIDHRKSRS